MKPMYEHAYYLTNALRKKDRKQTISAVVKILKRYQFDAIAFRGMSGALLAPVIADRLGKTLIMVRKEEDCNNHSGKRAEGDQGAQRYVIVDDLVSSGDTVLAIKDAIRVFAPKAVCIGVVQYNRMYLYEGNYAEERERLGYSDEPYVEPTSVDVLKPVGSPVQLTTTNIREAVDLLKPGEFLREGFVSYYSILTGVSK